MIDDETKAEIRRHLQEMKAGNAPTDASAFARNYEPKSEAEQKELVEFVCREARKMGTLIVGCP